MAYGRLKHASASITDQETKEKLVIVGGGYNGNKMSSTEILLNGQWVTGKDIFVAVCFFVPNCN